MVEDNVTLGQLGELRLIDEVILPIARFHDVVTAVGDDCAYFDVTGVLAVTADVGPKPLLHALPGYEEDLEAAGWMAVVATASDVATAGAEPFFLTNCIDANPDLTVGEFSQFLRGYFSACSYFGFKNGGGDVRHGPKLIARVFGAGICRHGRRLGRSGVRPGDSLALVGPAGTFMATYLLAHHGDPSIIKGGRLTAAAEKILRRPGPQLKAMQDLVGLDLVSAASDTSDGMMGALDNLCRSSNVGLSLELTSDMLSPTVSAAAAAHEVNPWNVFAAWGDWSVAVAIPADKVKKFVDVCGTNNVEHRVLGKAMLDLELRARVDGRAIQRLTMIRNENFVARGFNAGLTSHLDYILKTPLFEAL